METNINQNNLPIDDDNITEDIEEFVKIESLFNTDFIDIIKQYKHLYNVEINVYWCRHAESCANYQRNQLGENDTSRPTGYQQINHPQQIGFGFTDFMKSAISYIGTPYSALMSVNYEPPLTYMGIQQAVLLNQNFISKQQIIFDKIFCSTLTRAAMTTLFGFRNIDPELHIYVVPFVNELQNKIGTLDYSNYPNISLLMKKKIKLIKDWIEHNYFIYFDDIQVMTIFLDIFKNIDEVIAYLNENLLQSFFYYNDLIIIKNELHNFLFNKKETRRTSFL